MPISIRSATVSDAHFIAGLGANTAQDTTSSVRQVPADAAAAAFHRLQRFCARQPGTVTLVAEENGGMAGFLILLTDMPDDVSQRPQAFVAYMAVDAAHRGRGVGQALVAAAEREAMTRGLPTLSLMVACDNSVARRLYDKAGLVPERLQMTKFLGPPS